MALSEKNYVSQMKIGKLTNHSKGVLTLINKLLGVKFSIREMTEYDQDNSDEDNNEEEKEEENEEENEDEEMEEEDNNNSEEPIPFKQYIFSCVGIGLKNVARIELS